MQFDQTKITSGKELLSKLTPKIPASLNSIERQQFIGREIILKLSEKDRLVLNDFMNHLLVRMREFDASDIDLGGHTSGQKIWLRIHGRKKPYSSFGELDTDESSILIQGLLMESQMNLLYTDRNLDFSYTFENQTNLRYRHRADAYFDLDTLALNMRAINTEIRPYQGFGIHTNATKMLSLQYTKEGLNLITGITGSGKSSTLDAIVDLNNQSVEAHIIIIASPVEFVHQSKKCIIRHREVGKDTQSFKHGTIEALRQDPDIIIIGEMRDPETILAALEVADSGHKVFSTLHTSSAVESIDRIIGEVPPVEQERVKNRLSEILRCVISQKLVPSLDNRRVLAKELMLMTPSIRSAIKNDNTGEIYQMISEGSKFGMTTMEQDLIRLYQLRKISLETAVNYANNKRRIQQLLKVL